MDRMAERVQIRNHLPPAAVAVIMLRLKLVVDVRDGGPDAVRQWDGSGREEEIYLLMWHKVY